MSISASQKVYHIHFFSTVITIKYLRPDNVKYNSQGRREGVAEGQDPFEFEMHSSPNKIFQLLSVLNDVKGGSSFYFLCKTCFQPSNYIIGTGKHFKVSFANAVKLAIHHEIIRSFFVY